MISPLYGNKCAAKIGKVAAAAEPAAVVYAGGNVPAVSENEGGNVPVLVPKNGNKQGVFAPEAYQRQMAVIRAVCEKHQNLDAAQVKDLVNSLFAANGWKTLSVATIRRIIRENEHLLTAGRAGRRAHKSTIARQVKRVVTELPLAYWTMDGWTAELMYQERGAKGMEYRRLVIVVVLDAWTKYPIGYAIGDRENVDLIKAALKNALLHVRELFGEVYRPVQLQSDNYQIKNLTPFYTAVAHMHTPAEVGNAKAKVVEPYFKHLNKTYCQKQMNWTGFNVTARKENQVNAEYLNKVKGTFPDRNGVVKQLTYMMERERQLKREGYVAKWPEMPEDRKYRMSEMEWLSVFAKPIGKTNRITGEGLVKTIDGEKYVYDSFDPEFRALRHLNWQLYAEPGNMERVLVRDEDGKHAFVLEKTRVIPMDAWSATEDDHAYRAQITGYNKERETEVTELYAHDATVAREVVENTPLAMSSEDELALKLLLVHNGQQKEALQDAKGLPQAKKRLETMTDDAYQAEWQRRQEERMRGISDFDKY